YFVQIDALFGPGLPSETADIEEHPWVLEALLVPEDEDIKLPRSPKPELDESFSVSAPVVRNQVQRGTVTLAFDTAGRIKARWQCVYEQAEQHYQTVADMNGNIHVKRTYQDEEGKDKSRLFFIAKGGYTKAPLKSTESIGSEKGAAWLIGWIEPDHRIEGHVTITTDQEWAAAYAFESTQ
ncbi:MAG: hypothetical protein ABFR90_11340, partial [Planctomycetota bacterium]